MRNLSRLWFIGFESRHAPCPVRLTRAQQEKRAILSSKELRNIRRLPSDPTATKQNEHTQERTHSQPRSLFTTSHHLSPPLPQARTAHPASTSPLIVTFAGPSALLHPGSMVSHQTCMHTFCASRACGCPLCWQQRPRPLPLSLRSSARVCCPSLLFSRVSSRPPPLPKWLPCAPTLPTPSSSSSSNSSCCSSSRGPWPSSSTTCRTSSNTTNTTSATGMATMKCRTTSATPHSGRRRRSQGQHQRPERQGSRTSVQELCTSVQLR